ncbi:hypothetical protein [Chryseobacterium limigenitum]|uniref:Por secretion system C-terminal sorting domain-containing protein n=1 Tax=Chryseobacterium limigenitum TaxID=1612149 RepID=A0A1K2IKE6_9FLAO|nr:hypothetical protein [Chryseobacterium limigenitum]SFZ92929.1 hypothetical protein SAMN05216324_10450 [Chryseobacterium limigenitum]
MNKLLKSAFLVGSLFISASLMSKDRDFSLSIKTTEAKTISFDVLNGKNISLVIYNDAYGELFSEKLESENNVTKSYDLKDLESGTYYLVAESDQKIEKYKINISYNNKVEIEKTPFSEINKPEYIISGNMAQLHLSGLKNSATISVSDFAGNVYYNTTKNTANGELNMTFDLDPKTSDRYIISVEEKGNVFNKIVTLN